MVVVALLARDLDELWRGIRAVAAQVLMQPVMLLLVFGVVLPRLGYTPIGYDAVLLPGLVALNAFFAAVQNASFPLAMDFATGEIEARLALPVAWGWLAIEKVLAAAARGLLTAVLMVPIGAAMLGGLDWRESGIAPAAGCVVLGALCGGALGVCIGTTVPPRRIGVVFAVVMPPLLFTGSAQFPFPQLEAVPWFAVVCALNPMTYISEGLRGALTPAVPHLSLPLCAGTLAAATTLLLAIAVWTFRRRAAL